MLQREATVRFVRLKPSEYLGQVRAHEPPEVRDEKIADVCGTYREALARVARGERVISTDEMTGVQALERAAPGLPLRPRKVERREFEYIRHGTLSFIIKFDVVTGEVICPSIGPTRNEADFLAHIRSTVASDLSTSQWHIVVDNLSTHCSESLVRYVAQVSRITDDLGVIHVKPRDHSYEILDGHHRYVALVMSGRPDALCLIIDENSADKGDMGANIF